VRDEPFHCLTEPQEFIQRLKEQDIQADIFTFMQELADTTPRHPYHMERDNQAVIPLTTYDHWWKKQINDKSRNMIRKAAKNGVELRLVEFDDALVHGIMHIYDETPIRQGKRFWHYGKDFPTIKREHETFLNRSEFIGAFLGTELIGFAKLVYGRNVASLMQIISMIGHRDKAPTNALIAKAVERCAETGTGYLHYGVWSKGGLGMFKTSHAFIRQEVPRYFVPLTLRGRLLLKANLHRPWSEILPERWITKLAPVRERWNSLKYRTK
jgi:hypothetical protein